MQLCNMAEIEKEEVEFPASATLWQGNLHKVAAPYFCFVLYTIVQLYKEDWGILRMLGCRAVALPSTEQTVKCFQMLNIVGTWKLCLELYEMVGNPT